MPGLLRDVLLEHRQRQGEPADEAGLTGRLRLHQARHSYASYLIAAGVNPKATSTFMGHASINVTFDLYGHLMPGTAAEVAWLLSDYLGTHVPGRMANAKGPLPDPVA